MSEYDHHDLRRLFDRVSSAPADERGALLDRECGGDEQLKHRVLAMIAGAEDEQFLASPTGDAPPFDINADQPTASIAASSALHEGPGQSIGRYKLLQQIGEGGFGVVYMAEQTEPVSRRVALKIIKLGMDTKQVIARFEAERQALAMMDHPNIAKVLDAGATSGGRPYFVMELVKGVPITEYCDTHNLDVKQRLVLFQQVCHAVQHAHQKGIIHRDIKPSNVMITLHDGKPVPKVIDFGIAKATNARLTEKTLFTEYRQFIGTPEYMSPEQAEMSGLDIDTRSDVYSLGVLIYELLTGVTPFDGKKLRSAGYGEIQRIIREETPPKPSTRLSALDTLPAIAAHRHTEPKKLGVIIRGDLDWIVMKALEKDRQRRYETANGFAMDIERYLGNEPVTATPPSASYKLKKLIKRNKGVFSAAAIVFLVLTLGVIGTTWGLISTRAEYERAERELVRANEVKRLITEMFQSVDPEMAKGSDTTLLKGILDHTSARLTRGEVKDELIAAELHSVIGQVLTALGLFGGAEPHLTIAIEVHKRRLGDDHHHTLASMNHLAVLRWEQGHYAEAESLYLELIKIRTRLHGPEHHVTLYIINNLAVLRNFQGRHAEAEALIRPALDIQRRTLGEAHPETQMSINTLAAAYEGLGQYTEAESLYTESLESARRTGVSDEHPGTLKTMNNLANVYWKQSRYDESEALHRRTLEIRQRILGEGHPDTLRSMTNLAALHTEWGRFAQAEELYRKALEIRERLHPDGHLETMSSRLNLGVMHLNQGRFAEAESEFWAVLKEYAPVFGEDHPRLIMTMHNLGTLYRTMGRYTDADPLAQKAVELGRNALGPEHPNTLQAMYGLAVLRYYERRFDDADRLIRETIELQRRTLGEKNSQTVTSLLVLANVDTVLKRYDEAEATYLEVLAAQEELLGEDHRNTRLTLENLGRLYHNQSRYEDAAVQYRRLLEIEKRLYGSDHAALARAMEGMAKTYMKLDQRDEAIPLFRELLEYELAAAQQPNASASTLNSAAWRFLTQDIEEVRDPGRALPLAQRACALEESNGGANLWQYLDTLALAQHMTGDTAAAIETQKRAIALIPEGQSDATRAEYADRLAMFETALNDESATAVSKGGGP